MRRAGVGSSAVRYSYERTFTREVTGQFLETPRGAVKLFSWSDPQDEYPADALRVHAADARAFVVRAANEPIQSIEVEILESFDRPVSFVVLGAG